MRFEQLRFLTKDQTFRRPSAVLCDVDRTLLRHDHSLPHEVAVAARNLPVPLVLASARSLTGIGKVHARTGAQDLVVCFNGAWIGNLKTRESVHALPLPRDVAEFAFSLVLEHGGAPVWFDIDRAIALKTQAERAERRTMVTGDVLSLTDSPSKISASAFKLLATVDPDRITATAASLRDRLSGLANVAQSGPGLIEIVHPEVSKGVALGKVADILKVTPERIAAAGDSGNDIEMLGAAGLSIVPRNASADVASHADVMVPHCDEGGMAQGFRWLTSLPE